MGTSQLHSIAPVHRAMATVKLSARAVGEHQNAGPNSVSGLVSTLIPSLLVAIGLLVLFLFLRPRLQRVYIPRTYHGTLSTHQKTPRVSTSLFGWIPAFLSFDDTFVLRHHSLDAYLFLRFWKCLIIATAIGWPVTWIILMPVYATASGGQSQFNKISFSNIDAAVDSNRLYAVAFIAWIVLGTILYLIGRECLFSIKLQQRYLRLPANASRISSRTVLFTDVPVGDICSEQRLHELFPSAKNFWVAKDTEKLDDLLDDRDKAVKKYESALVKMSKAANKRQRELKKKNDTVVLEKGSQDSILSSVYEEDYPKHRLMPKLWKKVDTIPWAREQLQDLNPQIEETQKAVIEGKDNNLQAVFVEFETLETAEAAFHKARLGRWDQFSARAIGSKPQEIIWKNLKLGKKQRTVRYAAALAIIAAMIIFWSPITAFIGSLTNINYLTRKLPWLGFINDIPDPILGVVTGLLPVLLLALVLILVPVVMRVLFKLAGAVTLSEIELKTQTWYFIFQVIQVFLITTLSSGAAAVATQIVEEPYAATNLLAQNLPKSSNFYVSYFVLYGLSIAAKNLFNIVAVLVHFGLGKFVDNTPRKMHKREINFAGIKWGSVYPKFTNLAVIAITYSCIAPLVLAFATIGFILLGLAYRYALLYSVDVSFMDTRGKAYNKALQQLTTGVYLAEICLIGLFGIAAGSSADATGPLVLMIIFLIVTAGYHFLLGQAMSAMQDDLSDDTFGKTSDEENVLNRKAAKFSSTRNKVFDKYASYLGRVLQLPDIPEFCDFLETPISVYTKQEEEEAYMNPSLARRPPLVWTVNDSVGIYEREKKAAAEVVEVTDEGVYWTDKGKLTAVWCLHEKQIDTNALQAAPLWEKPVYY